MDLIEQIGQDALGLLAPTNCGQLGRDGADVVERAADLDQAVVQFVHRFGIFERIVVLVLVGLLVVDVDRLLPCRGRSLVIVGWDVERGRRCEEAVDGEVDGGLFF